MTKIKKTFGAFLSLQQIFNKMQEILKLRRKAFFGNDISYLFVCSPNALGLGSRHVLKGTEIDVTLLGGFFTGKSAGEIVRGRQPPSSIAEPFA